MSTTPLVDPHVAAVVARLVASGVSAGDHIKPGDDYPYAVVYWIAGGQSDGPVADPDADAQFVFQVTSVSDTAQGARIVADKTRTALIGHTLTVTGRSTEPIGLLAASPTVSRDDDVSPPLYYVIDRFELWSFPA